MRISYNILGILAAVLFCLFLQQCTQNIPLPAPAPKPVTAATRFADAIASGDVHTKQEKVLSAQPSTQTFQSSAQTQGKAPGTAGGATTAKKDACYDYFMVYFDNTGSEVGRDFLYSTCGGGVPPGGGSGGGDGGGGGSGGDSGSTGSPSPNAVLVIPPDKPINRVTIDC